MSNRKNIPCDKAGCSRPATILVALQDLGGESRWNACAIHARQFARWVQENDTDATAGLVLFDGLDYEQLSLPL